MYKYIFLETHCLKFLRTNAEAKGSILLFSGGDLGNDSGTGVETGAGAGVAGGDCAAAVGPLAGGEADAGAEAEAGGGLAGAGAPTGESAGRTLSPRDMVRREGLDEPARSGARRLTLFTGTTSRPGGGGRIRHANQSLQYKRMCSVSCHFTRRSIESTWVVPRTTSGGRTEARGTFDLVLVLVLAQTHLPESRIG